MRQLLHSRLWLQLPARILPDESDVLKIAPAVEVATFRQLLEEIVELLLFALTGQEQYARYTHLRIDTYVHVRVHI